MSLPTVSSPARIIKRHARHLYRANMVILWLYSFCITFPGLLWEGAGLLFPQITSQPFAAATSFLILILTTPLMLGWMRILYFLFMSDTSDRLPHHTFRELFYFYRHFPQTWKGVLLFDGVITAACALSYLLSWLQNTIPLETSPSWLQAGLVSLSFMVLGILLFLICRFLTAPYVFFCDERLPPALLLKKSLSHSAGYFGFILGFVLSMCFLALTFPVIFGLLAAFNIWVSAFSLWTANLLFSVLFLPYILLAIAGLASVLMPSEKETAKHRRR